MNNWRTTFFGSVTLIAAFVTQFPEMLEPLLDPALAKKIAAGCALFTGIVAFDNAKDRQVTGNGTIDFPARVPDPETAGAYSKKLPFALLLASSLLLSGCASTTIYGAGGRRLMHIEANAADVHFASAADGITFSAATLTHSAATSAVWSGINRVLKTAALGVAPFVPGVGELSLLPSAAQVATQFGPQHAP